MISELPYLIGLVAALAFSTWCASIALRKRSLLVVFWWANCFYLLVIILATVVATPIDFLGRPVSDSAASISFLAVNMVWQCLLGAFLAEWLVTNVGRRLQLRREPPDYKYGQGSVHVGKLRRVCAVGLACLAFPAAAIGAGWSYEQFVSGDSAGWGVTLYLMSVGAIPLIVQSGWSVPRKLVIGAPVVFAGALMSYSTGVRSLVAIPLLAVFVCLALEARDRRRIDWRKLTVATMIIVAVSVFAILSTRRPGATILPEVLVGTYFLHFANFEHAGSLPIGDNPALRVIVGLVSYPLGLLGLTFELTDPARHIASQVMGDWVVDYAHYPSTWYLDLLFSSGATAVLDAFILVAVMAALALALERRSTLALTLWPLFFWLQLLVVRGALYTGGATASAAATFLSVIMLAGLGIRVLTRKRH